MRKPQQSRLVGNTEIGTPESPGIPQHGGSIAQHGGSRKRKQASPRIEDYAVIGDCETAALVCRNGSIDWLCWPTFSSGSVFARLLGDEENGFFQICPAAEETVTGEDWRYLPHTLIVEKTWRTSEAEVVVLDFMPPRGEHSDVVRIVRGVRGSMTMQMRLALRFDYGCTIPWVERVDHHMRAIAGPHLVILRTDAPLRGQGMSTVSEFTVGEGEEVSFVLSYGSSMTQDPEGLNASGACQDTIDFWTEWVSRSKFDGTFRHHDAVERSLITLKALTYRPSGGQVAAVTTSLPEKIGGERNWDYRYCWIRDASFVILVLLNAGYEEEALAWRGWLLRAAAGAPNQLHVVYGINGERLLSESDAHWLSGYEGSRPVRIGNAASEQFQLDIFGEVIGALSHTPFSEGDIWNDSVRKLAAHLLDHLCHIWHHPDNGIWEVRNQKAHFVHSKVMAWAAFDRVITAFEKQHARLSPDATLRDRAEQERVERWRQNREELREEILEKGFNPKLNSFVQSYGSEQVDAACLQIPLVGFLPGDDPRVLGTLERIEKRLLRNDLILRYESDQDADGLPPGEGAFLACSFWYASALYKAGRSEEAVRFFDSLLDLRNDLGLLAEEYDPVAKRQLGNFPQGLTHLALCHCAMLLHGELDAGNPQAHPGNAETDL